MLHPFVHKIVYKMKLSTYLLPKLDTSSFPFDVKQHFAIKLSHFPEKILQAKKLSVYVSKHFNLSIVKASQYFYSTIAINIWFGN